jgi:hypothetical protein
LIAGRETQIGNHVRFEQSMARKKRRTREHVLADLSINHVERFVILCGFSCERVEHDYGTDLLIFTFDAKGEIENGHILVQVKATDHPHYYNEGETIACRVETADLWTWQVEPWPVILVRYDATVDRGYWLYVQKEMESANQTVLAPPNEDAPSHEDEPREHATLRVPVNNQLDCEAVMQFRGFRNHVLQQVKGVIRHDR